MSSINNGYKFGVSFDVTVHGTGSNQKIKDESRKVAEANDADTDAVSVVIKRLPVKYSNPIDKARSAIYSFLNTNSMRVNGQCLVPLTLVDKFERELDGKKADYLSAVAILLTACENGELAQEMEKLGDFKDQVKTLDCDAIRSRFGVSVKKAVDFDSPVVKGILSRMDAEVVTRLKDDCARDAKASYDEALTEITAHVSRPIHRMLKKLIEKAGVKGSHFKTILSDIKEIVEELPAYNVINDAGVSDTIAEIYKAFGTLTEADLKDEKAAEVVKDTAKSMLSRFGSIAK